MLSKEAPVSRLLRILPVMLIALVTAGPLTAAAAPNVRDVIAQASTTPTASVVVGTVTDTQGQPVADAQVLMVGPATYEARTDAHGKFTLNGVRAGVYSMAITRPGYNATTQEEFVVTPSSSQTLAITMQPVTFTSLREIGRVQVTGRRGTFNASPASVAVIGAQNFQDQAQTQVMRLLDQTPGVVTGHPNGTANQASPGAIQIPNIRGGLAFETSSLIDGHPLSVGRFGNYVITFLDPSVLDAAEIVKGPGANVPTINYAIGGTVNFRTLEPSKELNSQLRIGADSYGGTQDNFRYSNTWGKLGVLFDFALNSTPGPLNNFQALSVIPSGSVITGTNSAGAPVSGAFTCPAAPFRGTGCSAGGTAVVPGVPVSPFANPGFQNPPTSLAYTSLVGCCATIPTTFVDRTELVKFRYNFSGSTSFLASYLGSQADVGQEGNNFTQFHTIFAPGATYTNGALTPGNTYNINNVALRSPTSETNNEPIWQAELRTTMGKDVFLGRYYAASIGRLLYNTANNPADSYSQAMTLYGTGLVGGVQQTFNGQQVLVTLPGATVTPYFRQTEIDRLRGYSFQWTHPVGDKSIYTLGLDQTHSTTLYTTGGSTSALAPNGITINIPDGSSQDLTTVLARGFWNVGKAAITFTNYFNGYRTHYAVFTNTNTFTFSDQNTSHYDPRLGIEFRSSPNLALRFAAGSSIAPPYINLYTVNTRISYTGGNAFATQGIPNQALSPETAFGINLGADYRFQKDPATVLSLDLYNTALRNQFITSTFQIGTCNNLTPNTTSPCPAAGVPLYGNQNRNLANARYAGIELSLRRDVPIGVGYTINANVLTAYPYNIPPCFYGAGTSPCGFATNLAVVPNVNFLPGGNNINSVSNQSIPYAGGYFEVHRRWEGGLFASFGTTYYGNNTSFNTPPFLVANMTLRKDIAKDFSIQVSGDNLFNSYSTSWIQAYEGTHESLVNGKIGLTNANAFGPRRFRIILTKNFGPK